MYVIKMEHDKSLVCTVRADVYQGEKRADTLVFIVPKVYENVDLSECMMTLRYILPDGTGQSEELTLHEMPYNEDYYQYKLSVSSRFTNIAGTITLWLTALNFTYDVVLKSSETAIEILPAKIIDDYISDESKSQIDALAERIDKLQREKADNITYDDDSRKIQLLSGNSPIGIAAVVPSDKYGDRIEEAIEDIWCEIEIDEMETEEVREPI